MLTKLRIKNFKSWQDTGEMRMAPLTMYFGANSSGKSSILQFLLMLKQTAESDIAANQILDFGGEINDWVDLGNFRDVVYDHNEELKIEFQIQSFADANDLGEGRWGNYRVGNDQKLSPFYPFSHSSVGVKNGILFCNKFSSGDGWSDNLRFQDQKFYQSFRIRTDYHCNFDYIGPLRDFPKRQYLGNNFSPSIIGKRGQYAVNLIIADKVLSKQSLEEKVAESLQKIGLLESFKVKQIPHTDLYQVLVKKTKNSAEVLLTDVGFGVSQILPVLTSLFSSKPNSTIILEQPEIHLHPKAQAELADVIIEAINTRNIQVIIESHSEHLLSRIQSRIADGNFAKDKASLYFCKNETGASELEELKINDGGDIENWPVDFFGDMLGETANRVISYLERKEKNKKSK